MSRIAAEEAFRVLAKWTRERAPIHVAMSRSAMKIGGQRAASAAIVNKALPHSQKVLLTLRDENGDDVAVTVSLEGAEWETGAGCTCSPQQEEDAGAMLPEFAGTTWVCFLAATFPNGNRYVFEERAETAAE